MQNYPVTSFLVVWGILVVFAYVTLRSTDSSKKDDRPFFDHDCLPPLCHEFLSPSSPSPSLPPSSSPLVSGQIVDEKERFSQLYKKTSWVIEDAIGRNEFLSYWIHAIYINHSISRIIVVCRDTIADADADKLKTELVSHLAKWVSTTSSKYGNENKPMERDFIFFKLSDSERVW